MKINYMNKFSLFIKLYRKKFAENTILFFLFSLLAAAISMVLFVQNNNQSLFQNQLRQIGFSGIEAFSFAYQGTENVLGIIAVATILIGTGGGMCLIGFRNKSIEKSIVMMHIFGMQKKDLVIKAFMDAVIYAFLSSYIGCFCGYLLFIHFSNNILQTTVELAFISFQSIMVLCKTLGLVAYIVLFSNLYIDFKLTETPAAQVLYQRKGSGGQHHYLYILMAEIAGVVLYGALFFHVKRNYILIFGVAVLFLASILFGVFHLFFGVFTKKRRRTKKISSAKDLSFCFLCSRNRRDALLSIVISVGTILFCFAANIIFNISGMLRSAYQDNMGYTILLCADDFEQRSQIKDCLDENGFTYTFGYSKFMEYSQLNQMDGEEGQFYALVIEDQTDGNTHFAVPEGSFLAENYFATRCKLTEGLKTDIFGRETVYGGKMQGNQYLSLVSYNFIVNKEDWNLDIDDSWRAIFLLDASISEEKEIENLLADLDCHIESASELIDELKELLSDYLDILILMAAMIVLVTATIFYTVISSDLTNRKTEIYLYRVFGASFAKAQEVIFYEYSLIALISSFAVSFSIMVCGELYFYFGLKKHFPLSLPIIAATTALAVIFVFVCCRVAGYVNTKNTGLEVIRDE